MAVPISQSDMVNQGPPLAREALLGVQITVLAKKWLKPLIVLVLQQLYACCTSGTGIISFPRYGKWKYLKVA